MQRPDIGEGQRRRQAHALAQSNSEQLSMGAARRQRGRRRQHKERRRHQHTLHNRSPTRRPQMRPHPDAVPANSRSPIAYDDNERGPSAPTAPRLVNGRTKPKRTRAFLFPESQTRNTDPERPCRRPLAKLPAPSKLTRRARGQWGCGAPISHRAHCATERLQATAERTRNRAGHTARPPGKARYGHSLAHVAALELAPAAAASASRQAIRTAAPSTDATSPPNTRQHHISAPA